MRDTYETADTLYSPTADRIEHTGHCWVVRFTRRDNLTQHLRLYPHYGEARDAIDDMSANENIVVDQEPIIALDGAHHVFDSGEV